MRSRSNWETGCLAFSFAIYYLHGFRHTYNFPLTPFQHLQDRNYNSNFSHFQKIQWNHKTLELLNTSNILENPNRKVNATFKP